MPYLGFQPSPVPVNAANIAGLGTAAFTAATENRGFYTKITTATQSIIIPLSATAKKFLLRSHMFAQVNSFISARFSFDNGATYKSDANYYRQYNYGYNTGAAWATESAATGIVIAFANATSNSNFNGTVSDLILNPGSAIERPTISGLANGFNSTDGFAFNSNIWGNYTIASGRATHMQLIASVANGIGVNSEFILDEVL